MGWLLDWLIRIGGAAAAAVAVAKFAKEIMWFLAEIRKGLASMWRWLRDRPAWVWLVGSLSLGLVAAAGGVFAVNYCCDNCGDVFTDCDGCPEMVAVCAGGGNFQMGSPDEEPGHTATEGPLHPVMIPHSFAVGRYEVTRREYAQFVSDDGFIGNNTNCYYWDEKLRKFTEMPGTSWQNPRFAQMDNHPVTCVNWHDAKAYVKWLSKKTNKDYRLLTEAEWEYAARAGTASEKYFGNALTKACNYANGADEAFLVKRPWLIGKLPVYCSDGNEYTAPVGSYRPNAFHLYDMLGNVWEWVEDCWHNSYKEPLPDGRAPADGSAWTTGTCWGRVLRGGPWDGGPENLRSARRADGDPDMRGNSFGFRIARTLP